MFNNFLGDKIIWGLKVNHDTLSDFTASKVQYYIVEQVVVGTIPKLSHDLGHNIY